MRRSIILSLILIGLISLLTVFAIHFLPNPRTNSIVSSKAVLPNGITSKFYTYENNIYGISIDYPSMWEKVEFGRDNLIASFFSPSQNESGLLENVILQVVGLPYYNRTAIKDIVAEEVAAYKSELPNFQFLSSGSVATISGIPMYKIEYSHTRGQLQIKTMEIFTIRGNEGYKIIFSADTSEYANLVSIVEKMINSFNIKYPEHHQSTLVHI